MRLVFALLVGLMSSTTARTVRITGKPSFGAPIWTMPGDYPDVTVRQGDSLVFVYPQNNHDVSVVPTQAAFTNCDLTNKVTYALLNGSVAYGKPGTTTVDAFTLVTYIYPATTVGQVYFICGVGSHCLGGQKVRINVVSAVPGIAPVQVRVQSKPDVWTVGSNYPNITINLGDSLEFRSNDEHDVGLVSMAEFASCNTSYALPKLDWDSSALAVKTWTPTLAGEFYVICSFPMHCLYGQKFKVTVRSRSAAVSPVQASGGAVWTIANYPDITVNLNDFVQFSYLKGRHTVALLPSLADYEKCNNTNALIVSSADGSQSSNGTIAVTTLRVEYKFAATNPGVFYFACTVNNHCVRGMRFRLTVNPTSGTTQSTVFATTDMLFWTHDVSYPNVTIYSGQSLMFLGDAFGTHDISLVSQTTYQTKCGAGMLNATTDVVRQLYVTTSTAPFFWTPQAGTYYVICSFGSGFHCAAGMRFVVSVNPTPTATATPTNTVSRPFKAPIASPPVNSGICALPSFLLAFVLLLIVV
eukprot:TRINITY_DN41183_c0_g1_i1.p1 TRINITY_DN41183_c0_g1~~TRINITY_DN41183_c0_g1_i1.p1  ORF type:complete len:526 (+),score=48.52 TRINITY_DN41183_c0_g1_i1:101-1678(+)